ncbi:hypothetical protein BS47DRAFT_1387637 [Hydnum rufescens UP504]|uniref:Uncharacterized protein n=1 Tax=Hydnum rufescens UP504 TaxID=1448309 RepID=A0A9P6B955_9AGAM|nr:hypothetical protein BS47DRAFT_1387637 [Hydnum rufescens UP504]
MPFSSSPLGTPGFLRITAIVQLTASTNPINASQDSPWLRPITSSLLDDSGYATFVIYASTSAQSIRSQERESSLINAVFRAKTLARTSDDHATQRGIDQELASDDSHRLILHDSPGLAGGVIENLRTAQGFIKRSAEMVFKTCYLVRCAAGPQFLEVEFLSEMGYSSRTFANEGILISFLETGVSILTPGNVSSRIPSSNH